METIKQKNHVYTVLNGNALSGGELSKDIVETIRDKRDRYLESGRIQSYVMNDCFLCCPKTHRVHIQLKTPDDIWCGACGRNFFECHDITDYENFIGSVEIEDSDVSEELKEELKVKMLDFVKTKTAENNEVKFESKIKEGWQLTSYTYGIFAVSIIALIFLFLFFDVLGISTFLEDLFLP